jgi:hypothetical protein
MSNLKTAIQAIKAELKHAKEGLAFYQSRRGSLEDALAKLESVEVRGDAQPASPRKGRRGSAQPVDSKAGKQARGAAVRDGGKLPSTGKDFWPSLVGSQAQSSAEILDGAIKALGINPSPLQLKKLAQRQANAFSILCKKGLVSSSGKGRERRFFK